MQCSLICNRADAINPTELHTIKGTFCSHNKFERAMVDFSPIPLVTTTLNDLKNSGLSLIIASTFSSIKSPFTSGLSSWSSCVHTFALYWPMDDASKKKLKFVINNKEWVLPWRTYLHPISSSLTKLWSIIVKLPTPGSTNPFIISVPKAVAFTRHTWEFSRRVWPWSPHSLEVGVRNLITRQRKI